MDFDWDVVQNHEEKITYKGWAFSQYPTVDKMNIKVIDLISYP